MVIQFKALAKITLAILCVGITLTLADVMAHGISKIDKAKLSGSWLLVSLNNTLPDGKTIQGVGSNEGDVLVFQAKGRFIRAVASSRTIIGFGTYTVITDDGVLTLHEERNALLNRNGFVQKGIVSLSLLVN